MSKAITPLAAFVVSTFLLGACSAPPPAADVSTELQIGDLVSEGHSVEVSNCVTGLSEGLRRGDSQDQLIEACERAEEMLHAPKEVPEEMAFAGPVSYGDDPELDRLWDRCAAGDVSACDELWEAAPIGSEYERFGVTCGEREEVLNCVDLTADDLTADDVATDD